MTCDGFVMTLWQLWNFEFLAQSNLKKGGHTCPLLSPESTLVEGLIEGTSPYFGMFVFVPVLPTGRRNRTCTVHLQQAAPDVCMCTDQCPWWEQLFLFALFPKGTLLLPRRSGYQHYFQVFQMLRCSPRLMHLDELSRALYAVPCGGLFWGTCQTKWGVW